MVKVRDWVWGLKKDILSAPETSAELKNIKTRGVG